MLFRSNFTSERERIALEETDRQIGRIADLLAERFAPGEAVLIVTADHGQAPTVNLAGGVRLDPIQLERFLRRRYGPSVLPVVESVAPSEVYLSAAGLAEMGVSDAEVAASLLDSILGGSASSRLFQEIREKHGLAYTVYSSLSPFVDSGLFSVYAATSPARRRYSSGVKALNLTG